MHARARDRGLEQPTLHRIVVDNENRLRHLCFLKIEQRMLAQDR
jgi:hypothetical protein